MVTALRIRLIANSPPNVIAIKRAIRVSSIVILRVNVSTQVERIRSRSERTARVSSVSAWRSRITGPFFDFDFQKERGHPTSKKSFYPPRCCLICCIGGDGLNRACQPHQLRALRPQRCASFPCHTRHTRSEYPQDALQRHAFLSFHRLVTTGTPHDRRVIHSMLHIPSPRQLLHSAPTDFLSAFHRGALT